ncbi:sugar transporter ERD6 [Raphanus sativus]|uniref:Sugar transporter ERD6 n=1 Tax=Raphanus sativus TaxID=3726 RepID=A0A6J0KTF2_RAPSA|nr:sugar transporter ERD6 [Raphanus sativus]
MDRQKSMEKGLLRKSLSIRERKFPNEDLFLETGLSRKSPRDITKKSPRDITKKSPRDIIKKSQNDDGECRVTATVFLSTFVAVSGSFCTGCGAGFSSGAQSGITKDLSLSVAEYSMFGSILTLGGLIGAVFSGKVADVLGRKRTMLFCEAFCLTGWLAVALAQDALWLDCGRLLLGIGVGLFSYVIPIYIAEIAPKHVRGSFVFANQLMQNCGIALFFIIGNFIPWRWLAIVGFVPCVLHVFCLFFIPESPRWLAKKGRDKECRSALQRLRGPDVDISREASTIRDTIELSELDGETRMAELFQRRYAYPLLIGVGLMFLQQLSGSSGVTYYASSLFQKGGFPSAIGTSVIATIMVPKAMLGTIIVDKLGRRTLLMSSCAAMGLSALLLSVSYGFQSFGILPDLTPILTCIGVLGHIVSFAMGMGGLPWIIMAEIFPMNVKVSAGTLVTVTNWLFGWVITYTFNFMLQWNASGMFFIFSMVSTFSIVFIYFLVPETKGRSLEEIQALLSNFVQ